MDPDHVRRLSGILGHKWDLLILTRLADGPLRYSEIKWQVRDIDSDLSEGVLNKNLRRLAADGLICRPRVNRRRLYDLTRFGGFVVATLTKIVEFDEDDDDPPPDDRG